MPVSKSLSENIMHYRKLLQCDKNFDIICRCIRICGRSAGFFFIDGFIKDDIFEKLMEFFCKIDDPAVMNDARTFSRSALPYGEVSLENDEQKLIYNILSGVPALFVDGFDRCILIDTRTYPQRMSAEPDSDKSFRGSRDGFVETLVMNCALIRRRIREPSLCIELFSVGKTSKTDVAVLYMSDRADLKLLQKIRSRISGLSRSVDALSMNQQSLAENLIRHRYWNPFPKFKYTERPDTAAAQLIEGDLVVLVDNAPSAMLMPCTIFDIMEEANDYYFPPVTGSYLRLTRFAVTFLTTFLTPVWLLFLQNPSLLPEAFRFVLIDEPAAIPILAQLLILEFAVDGLKLASLNTPNMLTTSLGMIGAVIVGDFAVQSGWFCAEAMLYMAIVAIANYSQPDYELGYALKFMRMILLVATALLNVRGFFIGLVLIFIILASNKTVSGECYLSPLIPFRPKQLLHLLLRVRRPH